jgi:enoyl-CoA hydratase
MDELVMKPGLQLGTTAELIWRIVAEHVIQLGHSPTTATVFSTPNMIMLMERAARKALQPYLEPNEESVGAMVHVEHLAATPIRSLVTGIARVTNIQSRLIDFEITAFDRMEQIGRGTHRRAIIDLARFTPKLQAKTAALHSLPTTLEPPLPMMIQPSTGELPRLTTLELEVTGAILYVKLNRPAKRNAVNQQMTSDWEQLNAWLAGHPEQIRIVIISGQGGHFCAGDDVPEVGMLDLNTVRELSLRQAQLYLAWEQLPQVFIAATDGYVLGGGCVMAISADFRITTHNAIWGMPEIRLGWPPGYGIAQLTALVGKAKALELCLLGEQWNARQAAEAGLVHQVVAQNQLLSRAKALAMKLLALPSVALRETKRVLHQDEGQAAKVAYLNDTAAYVQCWQLPAAREGIAAFCEKRPAKFE